MQMRIAIAFFSLLLASLQLHAEAAGKVVAFAQDTMGNDWRIAQVEDVENGLKGKKGVCFLFSNAKGNTALQVKNIEDYIYSKVDVLITSPRDADVMTPVVSKAYREGIPVVLLTRTINGDDYTTFIHPDDRAIARKAARFIAEKLGGKGRILMLQGIPTSSTVNSRTEGFMEVIDTYPGITVAAVKAADYLRAKAIVKTEEALREGVHFDAIYAQSDSMAAGAIMALKKHGIDPKPLVITGIDYISEGRELIRSGELDATYRYPTGGKEGAEIALKILAGKTVPKEVVIDSAEVTSKNVEAILPIF